MKKYLFPIFIILLLLFSFNSVLAQGGNSTIGVTNNPPTGVTNNPTALNLDNPLGTAVSTPQILIGRIITAVMGIVGSIALLMFVYGGLIWMTSSGNQEKVKKGRDIVLWSAIGLIVIFMSYALTRFVLSTIAIG